MANKKIKIKEKEMLYQDIMSKYYPTFEDPNKNALNVANITFQVTDACNLRCTYCYQINKNNHVMPIEIAKKFIDLLLDNDENTKQYLNTEEKVGAIIEFIGGEPFLEIDLIDEITDYFVTQMILRDHPWQYHYMISIASNGTLYFNPKVQEYLKKHKHHISFSVSIDGNKTLHDTCRVFPDGSGSYDIAIAAVHHFINELGGNMGSKMTLSPDNIIYTFDAVKSLIEEGYTDINLNCVYEKGWTTEHATILYYQLKQLSDYITDNHLEEKVAISMFKEDSYRPKSRDENENWCGGNGQMISVDWKGDIYPCIRYMESSLGDEVPPIIIGNVFDGIMTDAKCKACINELKKVDRLSQSTEECINCKIADGCAWCQAYNYQDSGGDFNHRATYICDMHKATAMANSYHWNKIYLLNNEFYRMKLWLEDEKALEIIPKEELELLKLLQFPII